MIDKSEYLEIECEIAKKELVKTLMINETKRHNEQMKKLEKLLEK